MNATIAPVRGRHHHATCRVLTALAGAAALLLGPAATAGAHGAPRLVDLGYLPDMPTQATDINEHGVVVGYGGAWQATRMAFRWTPRSGLQPLGTLGGGTQQDSDFGSVAWDVNNAGAITGSAGTPTALEHAFLWTPTGGMRDLGSLAGPTGFSGAVAVNDHGQVAGGSQWAPGSYAHAFRWTARTGMQDLGALGGTLSNASAINDRGEICGIYQTAADVQRVFVWTPRSGMRDIGSLGGALVTTGEHSINDRGQLTGTSATATGQQQHAFLWSARSGMKDLGDLGGGYSNAAAINGRGDVTGVSTTASGVPHVFLWTRATGMRDLGDLGVPSAINGLAINDRDEVTGSAATPSGNFHAFLWTPATGMRDLGALPDGWQSGGTAINDRGQVAGWADSATSPSHAVVWQRR